MLGQNAVAESFFATLKAELIYRHVWPTRRQAELASPHPVVAVDVV
jgi:hypothetical protein